MSKVDQAAAITVKMDKQNLVWVPGYQPFSMNTKRLVEYLAGQARATTITMEYRIDVEQYATQTHKAMGQRIAKIAKAIGASATELAQVVNQGYSTNSFRVVLSR